jgi:hypothetical protein
MFILPILPLAPYRLIPSSFGYICDLQSIFFITYSDVVGLSWVFYTKVGDGNSPRNVGVPFQTTFQVAPTISGRAGGNESHSFFFPDFALL